MLLSVRMLYNESLTRASHFPEKAHEDHEVAISSSPSPSYAGGTVERRSPQHLLSLGRGKTKKEQQQQQNEVPAANTMPKKKSLVSTLKNKLPSVTQQPNRVPTALETQFMLELRKLRLPDDGKRKLKIEIQRLDHEIRKYMNNNSSKNIDELSDLVQNAYTRFADMVHNDPRFEIATNEDRDSAIDYFEKVVMTQNHK